MEMSRLIWRCINVATVLVVSVDAACPRSSTVIDMCDSKAFGGNSFYIDAARMVEGHHQCGCTLSTNAPDSIEMVEVTTTTSCRSYWYNATVSLGRHLDTLTYEYKNGSCVFPRVLGQLLYSSIPWFISITRRMGVLGEEEDPGFCMQVSSFGKTAFFVKCGNSSITTTSTILETSSASSASSSTKAITTSTDVSTSTTATESLLTIAKSTAPVTKSTSTVTTSKSAAETSTSFTATPASAAETSTSTPATPTSAAVTHPTTSRTSSQVLVSSVYTTLSTLTTTASSTPMSSVSLTTTTGRPASQETLHSTLDSIAIGASVVGLLLLILLVTLCVYVGHRTVKTYTKKDVENAVYVRDSI